MSLGIRRTQLTGESTGNRHYFKICPTITHFYLLPNSFIIQSYRKNIYECKDRINCKLSRNVTTFRVKALEGAKIAVILKFVLQLHTSLMPNNFITSRVTGKTYMSIDYTAFGQCNYFLVKPLGGAENVRYFEFYSTIAHFSLSVNNSITRKHLYECKVE